MKKLCALLSLFSVFLLFGCLQDSTKPKTSSVPISEASKLINEMNDSLGGLENYRNLKDVTFSLTYRDTLKKVQDVSTEKFLYEGELSWATYTEHTKNVFPESKNPVIQACNGREAWVITDGNFIPAPPAKKMAKFARNTSFFWFNMMYKMSDSGTIHKILPDRTFGGKEYNIVEVSYEENLGDAQDKFVLYLNKETKLVDHFIFSNMFFGPDVPPRMMHVDYETYHGLKFPKKLSYEMCNWEGNLKTGPMRAEKLFSNVEFNTDITKEQFEKPMLTKIPFADIRNAYLKKGISEEDIKKGKELITELENASGGYDNWSNNSEATFTQTADWYDNETNWTVNPQDFELTTKIGNSDGKLTLLNGPMKDQTWTIKNGIVYNWAGQKDDTNQEMMWHKQSYKSYWFQLPFKIREADIVSYGGKRTIKGAEYDVVYATWHSEAPNSKYDQYMMYLNPKTHHLEWLEFTVRDVFSMATAISQFSDHQTEDGFTLPKTQYITMGSLDRPGKKLHENIYKDFSFKK